MSVVFTSTSLASNTLLIISIYNIIRTLRLQYDRAFARDDEDIANSKIANSKIAKAIDERLECE